MELNMGCGGGQVVSVLAFYSNNPSSNPAEAYSFSVKFLFEKEQKQNKKRPGLVHFFKKNLRNKARAFAQLAMSLLPKPKENTEWKSSG